MKIYSIILLSALLTNCATKSRSLILGGAGGVAIGGYTGSAVYAGPKNQIKNRNTIMGAGIGLGVGLLVSYLLHNEADKRMQSLRLQNDERLHFGDLPPNPFSPSPFLQNSTSKLGGDQ
ncbi:hypothetical protein GW916_08225 [bacterium]|nr:hypothetical protein [bacterium]